MVSPYAAQRKKMRELLSGRPEVRVGTMHTFQGGERDVIVLSPTLSQNAKRQSVRRLAENQNLWNVAFARATSRLVVVGDATR
ncbi:AAA domain-containing protein [Saccharopolyspora spinosa]|uniref:AAA domain-containing protein n=1 Tax=Saccharopolyspora spinosa TaxID=60894 RepID=UPI000237B04C|nr:AAA domain-containing protein [Saccharopolyspora spinosa]